MTHTCSITNKPCDEPFPPFGESDIYPCDNCSVERMKLIHWADYYRHNTTPAINPYPYYSNQGMKYFGSYFIGRTVRYNILPEYALLDTETEEVFINATCPFYYFDSHYNYNLKKNKQP